MADIVNERDLLLQSAPSRLLTVSLASNMTVPGLKAVTLSAPATSFRVATSGQSDPTAIVINANLRGITGTPAMTWSVSPAGSATLTGSTYGVRTLAFSSMAQNYCTVHVEINDNSMIYADDLAFAKIYDGSAGVVGRRGSMNVARAIAGSTWSDAEVLQALAAAGATDPMATDVCTLFNASFGYAEMRRFDGSTWVVVGSSMPGSVLMNGSIVTEKLLVTGLGIALNPDPNTQDISAWTGTGLSIVADTTSPSGNSVLECTGLATAALSKKFPIDPAKNYKARLWTKQQSGNSTTYLTVAFYDASGAVITGTSNGVGWPGKGTYHYFGLVNGGLSAAWTEYSVSFGPNESAVLPSNARFMSIGALSNYTGSGVQRIAAPLVHLKTTGDMVVDGTITAGKIDARGLSIKDAAGNVILAAGTLLQAQYVTPDSGWLNSNLTPSISAAAATATWSGVSGANKPADNATSGSNLIRKGAFDDGLPGSWGYAGIENRINSGMPYAKNIYFHARDNLENGSDFAVTPGETIYGAAWLETRLISSYACYLGLRIADASGVVVGWTTLCGIGPDTGWTYVTGSAVVPAGGVTAVPWITLSGFDFPANYQWLRAAGLYIGRHQLGATVGAEFGVNIGGQITPSNASTYIANAAIKTAQIADLAVSSAKISDAAITQAKIGSAAVGSAQIANAAINSAQIANAAITTAKIGDAQVNTLQLASNAVTVSNSAGGVSPSTTLYVPANEYLTVIAIASCSSITISTGGSYFSIPYLYVTIDGTETSTYQGYSPDAGASEGSSALLAPATTLSARKTVFGGASGRTITVSSRQTQGSNTVLVAFGNLR